MEALYLFIARQLPEYPTFLQVDPTLLARMFAFFTSPPATTTPSLAPGAGWSPVMNDQAPVPSSRERLSDGRPTAI